MRKKIIFLSIVLMIGVGFFKFTDFNETAGEYAAESMM